MPVHSLSVWKWLSDIAIDMKTQDYPTCTNVKTHCQTPIFVPCLGQREYAWGSAWEAPGIEARESPGLGDYHSMDQSIGRMLHN